MTPLLRDLIDRQLTTLASARFVPDPLLGSHSLLASVLGAVSKRHGRIIEAAIADALRQNPDYSVWSDSRYMVAAAVENLVQSQAPGEIEATRLPYGATGSKKQIDLFAYWHPRRRLGSYEIKRGNGAHDSGKLDSIRRRLFAVQMTLASYGEQHGFAIDQAVSRIIFYYGKREVPPPWSLIGSELDEHFGCRVRPMVETATDYFRARIHDFIDGLDDLRPESRQLVLEGLR